MPTARPALAIAALIACHVAQADAQEYPTRTITLIVQFALSFSYAVLSESTLSFLGVGNPPPAPSWGAMLTGAYGYVEQAPWAAIFPGLAITVLILGVNVTGDGLQDLLDPTRR